MNSLTIESTIKRLLIDDLQVDPIMLANADDRTPLLGRGIGLDSVEALRLALGLENAFDLSIPDQDLTVEMFSSLGALTAYIETRLSERKGMPIEHSA